MLSLSEKAALFATRRRDLGLLAALPTNRTSLATPDANSFDSCKKKTAIMSKPKSSRQRSNRLGAAAEIRERAIELAASAVRAAKARGREPTAEDRRRWAETYRLVAEILFADAEAMDAAAPPASLSRGTVTAHRSGGAP